MLVLLIVVFCAAGAIFLVGLTAYNEFQDLWQHPDHRVVAGGSRHRNDRPT